MWHQVTTWGISLQILEEIQETVYKLLLAQISEQFSIQYSYKDLLYAEKSIIYAASGGALINKTSQEA